MAVSLVWYVCYEVSEGPVGPIIKADTATAAAKGYSKYAVLHCMTYWETVFSHKSISLLRTETNTGYKSRTRLTAGSHAKY